MALSAFAEKSRPPENADVDRVLGRSRVHWHSILEAIERDHPPVDRTWGHSGAQWGWALRLRRKKRTILYLTPCEKHFVAGFALGEKAFRAARASELSEAALGALADSVKYAEGRGVRLEVRNRRDRDDVLRLAAIKLEN